MLCGERSTEMKKIVVARRTIAGPEGTSQVAEITTPATDVATPMTMEYRVSVLRLEVN